MPTSSTFEWTSTRAHVSGYSAATASATFSTMEHPRLARPRAGLAPTLRDSRVWHKPGIRAFLHRVYYSLGPKLLTDFRFGYFRYRLNVNAQDNGQIPNLNPLVPGIFAGDRYCSRPLRHRSA